MLPETSKVTSPIGSALDEDHREIYQCRASLSLKELRSGSAALTLILERLLSMQMSLAIIGSLEFD